MSSAERVLHSGRRCGQLYAWLRDRAKSLMEQYGHANVSGSLCSHVMARALADELECHCCHWNAQDVYEFRREPFEQPVTAKDRRMWEVIR